MILIATPVRSVNLLVSVALLGPLLTLNAKQGFSQDRGLFYTPAEVVLWQDRAANGPYLTQGDMTTNSPGEWARLVDFAEQFRIDPDADDWDGTKPPEPHNNHHRLSAAALVSVVNGDVELADQVKQQLLDHAARITTADLDDFVTSEVGFHTANWLTRTLISYDLTNAHFSRSEQQTMESWYRTMAYYFADNVNDRMDDLFPNRLQGDYSVRAGAASNGGFNEGEITHVYADGSEGNQIYWIHKNYNNRRFSKIRFAGLAGAFLDDPTLVSYAKTFVKEFLRFSVFPDGTMGEYERNGDYGYPAQGALGYGAVNIEASINIADALARKGDFDLYEYATSEGIYGTEGGEKDIRLLIQTFNDILTDDVEWYHDSVSPENRLAIEVSGVDKTYVAYDVMFAMANHYYDEDTLNLIYTRRHPGMIPYPGSQYKHVGQVWWPWTGPTAVFPSYAFMYGDMEGEVSPYPEGRMPGDVNGDGHVNLDDFDIIRRNFLQSATLPEQGDLNRDGLVDYTDFRIWKDNAAPGTAAVSMGVPEPAGLWLALLAAGTLIGSAVRRRCAYVLVCTLCPVATPMVSGAEPPFRFQVHEMGRPGGRNFGQTSLVDVDNDGDLDFISGQRGGKVFWFEQRGPSDWKQHLIGGDAATDVGGVAFDVNGDGYVDQVSGGVWYCNPGNPSESHFRRFDTGAIRTHDNVVADINGDGRPDLVSLSDKDGVFWYAIPEDPESKWIEHPVMGLSDPPCHGGVAIGDLDGDGDVDLTRVDRWIENVDGKGQTWREHHVFAFGKLGPWGLQTRARVVDVDQDGDLDLVQAEGDVLDGRVAWFENLGEAKSWVRHLIMPEGHQQDFHSICVADFDNDGDPDIFSGGGPLTEGTRKWFIWENRGTAEDRWREHLVLTGYATHESVCADVDGDGDIDIATKPWDGDLHIFAENLLIQDSDSR